MCSFKLVLFCS